MKIDHRRRAAFTLVELLTGMGILVVMFSFLIMATNQMVRAMSSTTGKIEQFRDSRDAFERLTTRLAQATLNTYWDYKYLGSPPVPQYYERRSELRFISTHAQDLLGTTASPTQKMGQCVFFTAPLGYTETATLVGLENLMNTWGFYTEFSQDTAYRPKFIGTEVPAKWRWRLMEFSQSTERFNVYNITSGGTPTVPNAEKAGTQWIYNNTPSLFQASVRPVVENVVALILIPRLAKTDEENFIPPPVNKDQSVLAPTYTYDSTTVNTANPNINPKNQLPPVVQVTMVAIDSVSADRLSLDSSNYNMFGVQNKFRDTSKFTTELEGPDTSALEKQLIAKRVSYRVFTTNVHIRGSKWSTAQGDTSK